MRQYVPPQGGRAPASPPCQGPGWWEQSWDVPREQVCQGATESMGEAGVLSSPWGHVWKGNNNVVVGKLCEKENSQKMQGLSSTLGRFKQGARKRGGGRGEWTEAGWGAGSRLCWSVPRVCHGRHLLASASSLPATSPRPPPVPELHGAVPGRSPV